MARPTPSIPADKLSLYDALIATLPGVERKGAAMPYTSVGGHMFSFLTPTGALALRLPADALATFLAEQGGRPCVQHGALLKEYAEVPDALFARTAALRSTFALSHAYASGLRPKPTLAKTTARKR